MDTQLKGVEPILIEDLQVDPENPRWDRRSSQREALKTITHELGDKLYNLAESIAERGFNPFELPIVTPADVPKKYVVLEGNRRIAALKLLTSPSLVKSLGLSPKMTAKYLALCDVVGTILPKAIACSVMSREEARHWILLRHTGENNGVGVLPWDGPAKHRFRGNSPALQAIDLVADSKNLDRATREKLPSISITNIERLLGTPEAREILGVEVKGRSLSLKSPEDEALSRLTEVITDVAHGRIKVTGLDTKEQRIAYASDVAAKCQSMAGNSRSGQVGKETEGRVGSGAGAGTSRARSLERKTLAPRRLKLSIDELRIGRIYSEIQRLDAEKFTNSCAILLRVFVEMSVECYAKRHTIPMNKPPDPGKSGEFEDMIFRKKLNTVVEHMFANKVANKSELQGIRALIKERNHIFSIESWNGYVHNRHYHPDASTLKTNWDNIESFIVKIWPRSGKNS
jgi:hypothetical protein